MAKPAGYIEASDGGITFSVRTGAYVFIDARLPVQAQGWTTVAGNPRYRIQVWRQITLGVGDKTDERWDGWDGFPGIESESGVLDAAWKEYDDTPWNPAKPTGEPLDLGSFVTNTEEPRRASVPDHPVQPGRLHALMSAGSGEILAIHIGMENDDLFAASDPSSVRDYETIGRNTATWVPYACNESFSAWHAQRLIAQNFNKILFATKQEWTVPV